MSKQTNKLRIVGAAALGGLCCWAGFEASYKPKALWMKQTPSSVATPGATRSIAHTIPISPATGGASLPGPTADEHPDETQVRYLKLIQDMRIEERGRRLLAAFPNSEVGHTLAYAATFYYSGPAMNTPEGRFANEQLQKLRTEAAEAAPVLRDNLAHLGPDFQHERQFLTQVICNSDIKPTAKVDILSTQLKISVGEQSAADSDITFRQMMNKISDPSLLEPVLKEVLGSSGNPATKEILLTDFAMKYPAQAQQLRRDLGL